VFFPEEYGDVKTKKTENERINSTYEEYRHHSGVYFLRPSF
jgi:hypothetical protein